MKKSAISQRRPEYVLPRIPKFNDITPLGAGGPGTLRAGHCVCDSLWPDGSAPNVVPYGERPVWPDESALNVVPYGEMPVWPYGNEEY